MTGLKTIEWYLLKQIVEKWKEQQQTTNNQRTTEISSEDFHAGETNDAEDKVTKSV